MASLIVAIIVAPALHAAERTTVFTDDLAAAKTKAKEMHKDVFVDFTGSDWCGWCVTLDKEVFETTEFKAEAPAHFELVQLDFPSNKTKQSPEIQARNKAWKSELKSSSFPDALLLDENGRVFARTGYRAGGAKAYLEHLNELRQRRIRRDEALAKAEKAKGVDKAKYMDEALSALRSDDVLLTYYGAEIQQILSLAPKDEAGLQAKYKALFLRRKCENEIDALTREDDGKVMLAKFKEYSARKDIPVESRQYALYMAGALACERMLKDYPQALDLVKQAIELAPESQLVNERMIEAKKRLEQKISKSSGAKHAPSR